VYTLAYPLRRNCSTFCTGPIAPTATVFPSPLIDTLVPKTSPAFPNETVWLTHLSSINEYALTTPARSPPSSFPLAPATIVSPSEDTDRLRPSPSPELSPTKVCPLCIHSIGRVTVGNPLRALGEKLGDCDSTLGDILGRSSVNCILGFWDEGDPEPTSQGSEGKDGRRDVVGPSLLCIKLGCWESETEPSSPPRILGETLGTFEDGDRFELLGVLLDGPTEGEAVPRPLSKVGLGLVGDKAVVVGANDSLPLVLLGVSVNTTTGL